MTRTPTRVRGTILWVTLGRGALFLLVLEAARPAQALAVCTADVECDDGSIATGPEACVAGVCGPGFSLSGFAIGAPGATAYSAPVISVMDHAGTFYTGCCDTRIVAFTGESVERGSEVELCPEAPTFPACLLNGFCLCGYRRADGSPFVINGNFAGALLDPSYLSYDGHAGYDYRYASATPITATAAGVLCKAQEDSINGHFAAPSAWDKFHTFYVDHGVVGDWGYSSWYLHATDLLGTGSDGTLLVGLTPGGPCAPVAAGQVVAGVGNVGTFLPHLHFETRRYDPLDGPEAPSAVVIDPYGWASASVDPWSALGGNPQAAHNPHALWPGCGNARIDAGEDCDAGPVGNGCCTPSCGFAAAGTSCGTSGRLCVAPRCDGAGACLEVAAPRGDCRGATMPRRAALQLRRSPGAVVWRWRSGQATSAADLADPLGGDDYRLCAYDLSGPQATVAFALDAPASAGCGNGVCWKRGAGSSSTAPVRYLDPAPGADALRTLSVSPGSDGKARAAARAITDPLAPASRPVALPLLVQLQAENGACWQATFSAAGVRRNDADLLRVFSD